MGSSTAHQDRPISRGGALSLRAVPVLVGIGAAVVAILGTVSGCSDDVCELEAAAARAVAESGAAPIEHLERVVVSIPPLIGLVSPLVDDDVEVVSLVPAGMSVHGWEPGPADLASAAKSDLLVFVGLGIEAGSVERMTRGRATFRLADTLGLTGGTCDHPEHNHNHSDGHIHGDDHARDQGVDLPSGMHVDDAHIWLDPRLMRETVRRTAASLRVRGVDVPAEREAALLSQIDDLDAWSRARLAPFQGQAVMTHHGAFAGLLQAYGLTELGSLLPAPGTEPTAGELARLRAETVDHNIRAVFTEPHLPSDGVLRISKELGLPVGELDPLGRGDWLGLIRQNVDTIALTLERANGTPD
jgi:ABC-type Zn uptake system ZnuABC Zn-binding protein ZnuA